MLMNDYIDFSASQSMDDELRVFMHDQMWVTENCISPTEREKNTKMLLKMWFFFKVQLLNKRHLHTIKHNIKDISDSKQKSFIMHLKRNNIIYGCNWI